MKVDNIKWAEYDAAWKHYAPILKKQKKSLRNLAKKYLITDFGFMDYIVFQAIRMIFDWYTNPKLLIQDTTWEFSHYDEGVKAITRCKEIVDELSTCCYIDEQYSPLRKELYTLIGEFGELWWD